MEAPVASITASTRKRQAGRRPDENVLGFKSPASSSLDSITFFKHACTGSLGACAKRQSTNLKFEVSEKGRGNWRTTHDLAGFRACADAYHVTDGRHDRGSGVHDLESELERPKLI